MCTNTEEFDLSFGRNEFGDQAEWQMMLFHVWISSKNSNIKYNQNKEIQQWVYTFKFGVKFKIPEQFEVRESLLSFGAESFIFQFAIQKQKDQVTQNCNFASCFVWVKGLVSYIEGRMQAGGVQQVLRKVYGPMRDVVTWELRRHRVRSFTLCTHHQILIRWSNQEA
jgi:hypothetical protein